MNRLCIALLLCLTACSTEPPPPPPPATLPPVPAALQTCAEATLVPKRPQEPRTLKQFVDWTDSLFTALIRTQKARSDCAERLAQLNAWVVAQQPK